MGVPYNIVQIVAPCCPNETILIIFEQWQSQVVSYTYSELGLVRYDLNPIWVRLLGRLQLSNPSDLLYLFYKSYLGLNIPSLKTIDYLMYDIIAKA